MRGAGCGRRHAPDRPDPSIVAGHRPPWRPVRRAFRSCHTATRAR